MYRARMDSDEKQKAEGLRKELTDICNDLHIVSCRHRDGSLDMERFMDNQEWYIIKYLNKAGYIHLVGYCGSFWMADGFPTMSRECAKYLLLKSKLLEAGQEYERINRFYLEKQWAKNIKTAYDHRKAAFEYAIKNLMTIFNNLPEELIDECSGLLNNREPDFWRYNSETRVFEKAMSDTGEARGNESVL